MAFVEGPGGFRELREAGKNRFHLSWYLLVPGVTSYDRFSLNGPHPRGGTQDTDFNKGFTKGFFTKKYSAKIWGGQGDPDPLIFQSGH